MNLVPHLHSQKIFNPILFNLFHLYSFSIFKLLFFTIYFYSFIKMQPIYFIILTILFLAFSKVENAGEILLTNLPNEKNQIRIPLQKNEGSAVGFHIKWAEGFCKPDGLLICYLSKLNVEGKMTKRFKIGQRKNGTKIREKCEEKMNLEYKNGEIWNGILLEGSSDLGRNIKMELSLTGEKYYFDGGEFTLELGTPTKLKINEGNLGIDQINAEEMDFYNNFTGQINEGAYFDDFLGLWALGMDLLPSNGESLEIYVFRSCDCTMKAWFLPNSSPEKLPEWGQIDKRAECPEDKQKNYIELPNPLGKGKLLNISLKLAENTLTQVEIILYHRWTKETWSKYVGAIIDDQLEMYWAKAIDPVKNWQNYNYGDLLNITIKLGKEPKIELENFDRRENYSFDGIGNGKDGRFTFQILQNEYNLSIGFNGEGWIVQDFWLKNWFHEIGVNIIKLEKLQFLLAEPPVAQFEANDLPKYGWVHVHKLAKELKGNELIILRAIMPKHIDEDGVNIKFLYNTNSEYVGNLHSSDHFYIVGESILAIKTNSHSIDKINVVPGMKPDKEGIKKENPLEPGKLFELRIIIPPRKFGENEAVEKYGISTYFNHTIIDEIEVDKTKFPLWKINRILIQGAQLIEEPRIIIPKEEKEKTTDYSINIRNLDYSDGKKGDLLLLGDQILIEGTVPQNAQEFIINLCFHEDNCMIHIPTPFPEDVHHPINKESKIGGIVLYIRVIFNSTNVDIDHRNKFLLNSWLRENDEGGIWQEEIEKKSHDLVPGKEFKMKIEVGELRPHTWHFLVMLNEQWAILDISEPCDESFGKCRMAPWSADHLQIFGDVKIPIGSITRKNIKQNDRALPYIKHFENGFQINENVSYSIKGTHKVNNMSNENKKAFTIGIYHDGIGNFDWQRKLYGVGESLIQLDFMMDGIIIVTTFSKYYALDGEMMLKPKTTIDGKWRNQKQIEVQIGLAVYNIGSIIEMFTIKVNQNDKIQTSALELDLPLWAGDYLYINTHTISGNFELTKEPDYVEN